MNFYNEILAGTYDTKLSYPETPRMPASLKLTAREFANLSSKDRAKAQKEIKKYEKELEERKEKIKAIQEDEARLIKQFHNDLASYHGLKDHPKEKLLWSKAWELGHYSGLSEVYSWYSELSELLD